MPSIFSNSRLSRLVIPLFFGVVALGLEYLPQKHASLAVVQVETQRRDVIDPLHRDRLRRRQAVSETLDNEKALYFANLTVGTPAQKVRLHLDTGSSDMWVNTASSQICSFRGSPCSTGGTYNANSSSTYHYIESDFNISYVDGSGASGDYVIDHVVLGGKALSGLQFGVGYESTTPEGILGIGYMSNEGWVNRAKKKAYSNLPQAMVDAGYTKSNAYSLWLDDLEANTGSVLFGGVDTNKYHGPLLSLPIQKVQGEYAEFIITLSGMELAHGENKTTLKTSLPSPVILDSGSSLTYLPQDITSSLFSSLGVQYSSREQAGYVDCSLADENLNLTFSFTTANISIPISELVINPTNADTGNGQTFSVQSQLCLFGITYTQGNTPVLGDTFLRSAYVVFDLANNEISLAQTNTEATTANVVEIGNGTNSVPGASAISNPVQVQVSQTANSRIAAASSTQSSRSSANPAGAPPTYIMILGSVVITCCCL